MDKCFKLDLKEIQSKINSLENKIGYIPKPALTLSSVMYSGCGSGGCVASCSGDCAGNAYDSCILFL